MNPTGMMTFYKNDIGKERNFGLDILRALAILFVLISHGSSYITNPYLLTLSNLFSFDGVTIFFVLSGYLIGSILIKTAVFNEPLIKTLVNFWIRRWLRTIPTYFLVLSTVLLLLLLFRQEFPKEIWKYFLFVQNFNSPHPGFFSIAWSLSVEEWFYLLIPPAVMSFSIMFKSTKRAILAVSFLVIVGVSYYRLHRFINFPITTFEQWDIYFRKQVLTRLDAPMYGVLGSFLSYYYNHHWKKYRKMLLLFGASLIVTHKILEMNSDFFNPFYHSVFSFAITGIASLSIMPYFITEFKRSRGVFFKVVTYTSLTSYSMYLIHVPIIQHYVVSIFMKRVSWANLSLAYLLYWFSTFLFSILLYSYFERPVTDLRSKFVITN